MFWFRLISLLKLYFSPWPQTTFTHLLGNSFSSTMQLWITRTQFCLSSLQLETQDNHILPCFSKFWRILALVFSLWMRWGNNYNCFIMSVPLEDPGFNTKPSYLHSSASGLPQQLSKFPKKSSKKSSLAPQSYLLYLNIFVTPNPSWMPKCQRLFPL